MSFYIFLVLIFILQIVFSNSINSLFFTQLITIFLPTVLYCKLKKENVKDHFKIKSPNIVKNVFIAVITVISVNVISIYINAPLCNALGVKINVYSFENSEAGLISQILLLCIIPSVFEELLFRGVVLKKLLKKSGYIFAILISSLIFSVFHLKVANFVPQLLIGFLLSLFAISTGSIIVSVVAHFANNLFIILCNQYIPILISDYFFILLLLSITISTIGVVYFKTNISRREI